MACGTCDDQCYCAIGAGDTSIAVTGNGGGDLPYAVRVRRSATTDNQIQLLGDGIYVASTATVSANRSICTSSTRPAGFIGLEIFETDTGRTYVYNGSWIWQRSLNGEAVVKTSATGGFSGYSSASMGAYVTIPGSVTVPSWAARAEVSFTAFGVYGAGTYGSSPNCVMKFRAAIGSDVGATTGQVTIFPQVASPVAFTDIVTLTSTGSKSVTLQAQKVLGGNLNDDANTVVQAVLRFLPA